MDGLYYQQNNIKKITIKNIDLKQSLVENKNTNNYQRLYLQRNSEEVNTFYTNRYDEKYRCCDCNSQPNIIPHRGYSCLLNNKKNQNLRR